MAAMYKSMSIMLQGLLHKMVHGIAFSERKEKMVSVWYVLFLPPYSVSGFWFVVSVKFIFFFNWKIIALQCNVGFCYTIA